MPQGRPTIQRLHPPPPTASPKEVKTIEQGIEDSIRKDYETKLPQFEKIFEFSRAEIDYLIRHIKLGLKGYEKIRLCGRIKTISKCINKLKKMNEGNILTSNSGLSQINDIIGLRIVVFPEQHFDGIRKAIKEAFPDAKEEHQETESISDFDTKLTRSYVENPRLP